MLRTEKNLLKLPKEIQALSEEKEILKKNIFSIQQHQGRQQKGISSGQVNATRNTLLKLQKRYKEVKELLKDYFLQLEKDTEERLKKLEQQ